ncbi:MAG: AraC family transcriptional regulator [Erysipelotrichaceae bacterium]|nr:AraC family transcriptional regulator [Erysipelotrichaceae bacterium]
MNNIEEELIKFIKAFHNITNLPVQVFLNNECIYSIPSQILTSYKIINDKNLIPKYSRKDNKIQIVNNKLKESYFIKNIDKYSIHIGPFLREKIESGFITNMIRDNIIPFHQKTNMQDYYRKCIYLNDERIYYINKLLENSLYFTNAERINSNIDEYHIDEDNSYFEQKSEYQEQGFIHSPYNIEQEISQTISNGNTENAKRLLKEINTIPHAKLASTTLRSYKNSMICSCAFMTRAAINGGVNPDEAFTLSDTYINKIENMSNIIELEEFETIMVESFSEKVRDVKKLAYSSAVLKVIYYIDNHIREDIDIKQIAKEVYLNPSYLSTLFHKETGSTIKDWIIKRKIQEASLLVKNSNEDLASIAFTYRFCSQSYFVQCFKKIMGITPGEYRKRNK